MGRRKFGELPKRLVMDFVSCLFHDTEEAWTQVWASTLVTFDVQGAFDSALHDQLLRRIRAHNWPSQILRWTSSFLEKQQYVKFRHSGELAEPKYLTCGVPQGSPISPLVFPLFTAEPFKHHVPVRCGKAISIAQHLRKLKSIKLGPAPGPLVQRYTCL